MFPDPRLLARTFILSGSVCSFSVMSSASSTSGEAAKAATYPYRPRCLCSRPSGSSTAASWSRLHFLHQAHLCLLLLEEPLRLVLAVLVRTACSFRLPLYVAVGEGSGASAGQHKRPPARGSQRYRGGEQWAATTSFGLDTWSRRCWKPQRGKKSGCRYHLRDLASMGLSAAACAGGGALRAGSH